MKIAIPTDDKSTICSHFGRASGFMVYRIVDRAVVETEYRQNTFTGHAQGHHHEHNHHGGDHQHSHAAILQALGDCEIVIAKGMGRRIYNDFEQWKILVFITKENNLNAAIDAFLKNTLDSDIEQLCKH